MKNGCVKVETSFGVLSNIRLKDGHVDIDELKRRTLYRDFLIGIEQDDSRPYEAYKMVLTEEGKKLWDKKKKEIDELIKQGWS